MQSGMFFSRTQKRCEGRSEHPPVHQHDLGTILWFEPERITPEATWIRENHPEWVVSADTTAQGLFDFGNPAALAWMNDRIDAELTDNQIDFYRVDFNMDPLERPVTAKGYTLRATKRFHHAAVDL